jgi:hypothetical protein
MMTGRGRSGTAFSTFKKAAIQIVATYPTCTLIIPLIATQILVVIGNSGGNTNNTMIGCEKRNRQDQVLQHTSPNFL